MNPSDAILLDAGVFIGALLRGDRRHEEARPLVEAARSGALYACTTLGILSEVYMRLSPGKAHNRPTFPRRPQQP